MIIEVKFGTVIKLGKTLVMSWHLKSDGKRFKCHKEGGQFLFEDTMGEFPSTGTSLANVSYWLEKDDTPDFESQEHLVEPAEPKRRGRKPNDKPE